MTTQVRPLNEVNHEAIRLLSERLGIVDTIRFVNQFTTGHGNYTEERDSLFGHLTLDEIISRIETNRSGRQTSPSKTDGKKPASSAEK